MATGTAETVIKVEVTESRIEVVPQEQVDDPLAQPVALGVGRRAVQLAPHLGNLVDPLADVFAATGILGLASPLFWSLPERVHRMPEDRWRQARPARRPRARLIFSWFSLN
jgi:hypothetical protein